MSYKRANLLFCVAVLHAVCAAAQEQTPNRDAYIDRMLDPKTAASIVQGFKRKSATAVVYLCYNRTSMIEPALAAVLRSEGLSKYDLLISQDGVHGDELLKFIVPEGVNWAYIRHTERLNAGLHHFYIKQLVFAVLGYEDLIVIEEDIIVHPQAIQMLKSMLDMSVDDLDIGLVSIVDSDNSAFVDLGLYNHTVLRVAISEGHLWAYGMHATRFRAAREHLMDYAELIRRDDYTNLHKDPLAANIKAMYARKGIPLTIPMSQDANLQFSLRLEGFDRRLTTVARLFKPIGHWGLHFRDDESTFYGRFGRDMFEPPVTFPPVEATRQVEADMAATCRHKLDKLFMDSIGRHPDEKAFSYAVARLLGGKMNGIVLVACVTKTAKRRTPECRDMYWV